VFVDPEDHGALASTLNALIEDEAGREKLAARARIRAAEFSPQRMAAGYRKAYADCLNAPHVEMLT
jgi:glycosyltransferase involved in cell wall biosynthesis